MTQQGRYGSSPVSTSNSIPHFAFYNSAVLYYMQYMQYCKVIWNGEREQTLTNLSEIQRTYETTNLVYHSDESTRKRN